MRPHTTTKFSWAGERDAKYSNLICSAININVTITSATVANVGAQMADAFG